MKSNQLNTSEQPPTASASSPRDNPCLERDSTIAALEAIADDGISFPVTNPTAGLDDVRSILNGEPIRNRASPIYLAVTLLALLLAAQILP